MQYKIFNKIDTTNILRGSQIHYKMQLNSTCKIIQQIFQTKNMGNYQKQLQLLHIDFSKINVLYKNLNILIPNYQLYSIVTLQNGPCLADKGKEQLGFLYSTHIYTPSHIQTATMYITGTRVSKETL